MTTPTINPEGLPTRTLHCANRALYAAVSAAVLGVCIYAALAPGPDYRPPLAIAAGIICLLWGGGYASLSYTVSPQGITRSIFFVLKRRYTWQNLGPAEFHCIDAPGERSVSLIFSNLTLSGELLDPDALEELANDLRVAGMLGRVG
ncbi:MAG: hypothetical protein ACI4PY_03360 [Akkermansia muciniphila]|nr:hypothetical protein [Akkermansia muciniphila]MCI7005501.1 hypothetical protein [Akkermansia muciniphila]